jgi:hypothetical protein
LENKSTYAFGYALNDGHHDVSKDLQMHGNQPLRFARLRLRGFDERDRFAGGDFGGDGGFERGDDLSEGLALASAAGFNASEVGDAGDDRSIRSGRRDVNHAVEDWHISLRRRDVRHERPPLPEGAGR